MSSTTRATWTVRVRLVLFGVAAVVLMFLFVFPTRSWLAQKHEVDRVTHDLAVLNAQNRVLQRESDRLDTPAEVEKIARERYDMIRLGETAFGIIPAPPKRPATTTTQPNGSASTSPSTVASKP